MITSPNLEDVASRCWSSAEVFAQFDLGQKLIGPADTAFLERVVCCNPATWDFVGSSANSGEFHANPADWWCSEVPLCPKVFHYTYFMNVRGGMSQGLGLRPVDEDRLKDTDSQCHMAHGWTLPTSGLAYLDQTWQDSLAGRGSTTGLQGRKTFVDN